MAPVGHGYSRAREGPRGSGKWGHKAPTIATASDSSSSPYGTVSGLGPLFGGPRPLLVTVLVPGGS